MPSCGFGVRMDKMRDYQRRAPVDTINTEKLRGVLADLRSFGGRPIRRPALSGPPRRDLETATGANRGWSEGSCCDHKLMSLAMACR